MNNWLKWVSFILMVTMVIVFVNTETFSLLVQGDLEEVASSDGLWTLLLLSLFLMTIQNLFTVIPLILLVTINVTLFGFVNGYLWSWFSSLVGATVSFFAVRYWFQAFFRKKVKESIQAKIRKNGFAYVFIGRVFPFVPTSFINIASGASTIKYAHFIVSTMIGNLIYMLVLSLIPLGIMSLELELYFYVILSVVLLVGIAIYLIIRKRKRRSL